MARETWVLNASPLIVLAKSGRLDLLLDPARELLIPEAVAREVGVAPADDPARLALEAGFAGAPEVVQVSGDILEWGLGCFTSLVARKAIAVVDDRDARRAARALGVSTIGMLGVVLAARGDGRIVSAAEVFLDLRRAGLWFKDDSSDAARRSCSSGCRSGSNRVINRRSTRTRRRGRSYRVRPGYGLDIGGWIPGSD
ncbi:MAG: DUF3368 domain-containing protein [Pseudomonadota bacterium]|nr:DUF3368 domain-containing protein [Pseudomonadota bacterium]